MDYRDQDGNNEGLFGARNENSVLFSLDSLTSLDNDSSASAGSNFGSSGDASGLIDLNTLSKMSGGGSADDDGEGGGAPVMESMVFNQVVTKKKKQTVLFVVLGFVFVIIAAVGIIFYLHSTNQAEMLAQQAEQERIQAEDAKKAEELQAQIAKLQALKDQAESDNTRRQADIEKVKEEEARLRAQLEQMGAAAAPDAGSTGNTGSGSSKKGGSKSGASAPSGASDAAPAAPSAPKTKAPDKAALVAALKDANTKAAKCGKGGSLTVQFNLSNNSAKGVKAVGGNLMGTATEKCVLTVVEKYRWPDGTASGIKYPFKF